MSNESGHWYRPDGTPCHFVPRAKGGGTRPTTLRDARAMGLYPSVTSILKVLDKPALVEWKVRQAVMAVCTAPDVPGECLDAKITRILDTEQQQDQEARQAADRGTEIHDAIEKLYRGEQNTINQDLLPWIMPAYMATAKGRTLATEKIIIGDGYGGRVDLIQSQSEGITVVDWKTTKKLPKNGAYFEAQLQLAAYAKVVHCAYGKPVKTVNVYISTTEKGAYVVCENPDWQHPFSAFQHLVHVWQYLNDYYPPRKSLSDGESLASATSSTDSLGLQLTTRGGQ